MVSGDIRFEDAGHCARSIPVLLRVFDLIDMVEPFKRRITVLIVIEELQLAAIVKHRIGIHDQRDIARRFVPRKSSDRIGTYDGFGRCDPRPIFIKDGFNTDSSNLVMNCMICSFVLPPNGLK